VRRGAGLWDGSKGKALVGGLKLFVNERLNFDVLEEKNSKAAKKYRHRKLGSYKGAVALDCIVGAIFIHFQCLFS